MNFYQLGYAIAAVLSQPPTFSPVEFSSKSRKQCKSGYGCGWTCISTKKKCRVAVTGEAKNFAQYVRQHKGKLTAIQQQKAKAQNIGLKAGERIKQQKNDLIEKKQPYINGLSDTQKKVFVSTMQELKKEVDQRRDAAKYDRAVPVRIQNERWLDHQVADDFHSALKKGYSPDQSAAYAKTRIGFAIKAYNKDMAQLPQIKPHELFRKEVYDKEIDRIRDVFSEKAGTNRPATPKKENDPKPISQETKYPQKTAWPEHNGKKPWQAPRNGFSGSLNEIKDAIESKIKDRVTNHPLYSDLEKRVHRSSPLKNENYDMVMAYEPFNSTSASAAKIKSLQSQILNDLKINKQPTPGSVFKTRGIDWHRAAVVVAKEEGENVPDDVLRSFSL